MVEVHHFGFLSSTSPEQTRIGRRHSEQLAMTHKMITREFVVPAVLAIVARDGPLDRRRLLDEPILRPHRSAGGLSLRRRQPLICRIAKPSARPLRVCYFLRPHVRRDDEWPIDQSTNESNTSTSPPIACNWPRLRKIANLALSSGRWLRSG